MMKTYTLPHNHQLNHFLRAYLTMLNLMIDDIWNHIQWREKQVRGKKQKRLLPTTPTYTFRKKMREKYLEGWSYARHWVDSAIKTAFSTINSWKRNYKKGKRKRRKPEVRRPFARVKQTLMKVSGDKLRITIKPHQHITVDLSKRYFPLRGRVGEPILTPTKSTSPWRSAPQVSLRRWAGTQTCTPLTASHHAGDG